MSISIKLSSQVQVQCTQFILDNFEIESIKIEKQDILIRTSHPEGTTKSRSFRLYMNSDNSDLLTVVISDLHYLLLDRCTVLNAPFTTFEQFKNTLNLLKITQ